jgi:hypothetical protein
MAQTYDDMQSVAGVGDEAFSAGGQLTVRKGATALVVLAAGIGGCGRAAVPRERPPAAARTTGAPSAVVARGEARFRIPEPPRSVYLWNLPATGEAGHEYGWMVRVPGSAPDSGWEVGYSFFRGYAGPDSGSLAELLAAGQSDAWHVEPDGSARVLEASRGVTARPDSMAVVIQLSDGALIDRLFGGHPPTVNLRRRHPGGEWADSTVPVSYVNADSLPAEP